MGGFTITLTAQLGTGATAGNWKAEMLNFNEDTGGWVDVGFLTGGTSIETASAVGHQWFIIRMQIACEAETMFASI